MPLVGPRHRQRMPLICGKAERGLKGEADQNRDGRVQVSELRDFVEQEVRRLTNGRQSPTSRRENLLFDFTLD